MIYITKIRYEKSPGEEERLKKIAIMLLNGKEDKQKKSFAKTKKVV